MIDLLLAAAAAQGPIITRLPPVLPVPMEIAPAELRLPDLTIGEIRVLGESLIEVEVRNRGKAATPGPVRMHACVQAGAQPNNTYSRTYCSADKIVGTLAPGQSRRVAIDCFYGPGRLAPGSTGGGVFGPTTPGYTYLAPMCENAGDGVAIARYSATVDPYVWPHADQRRPLPAELQRGECSYDYGCVRESNEKNNSKDLDLPPSR